MGARGGCARAPGAGGWTVRTGGRPTAKRRNARAEKGGERERGEDARADGRGRGGRASRGRGAQLDWDGGSEGWTAGIGLGEMGAGWSRRRGLVDGAPVQQRISI